MLQPTPASPGYGEIFAIGRDSAIEHELGILGSAPTGEQWSELVSLIERVAENLGVPAVLPRQPDFLLQQDLTKHQREALDAVFIPRYARALEAAEEPREYMEYRECRERMTNLKDGSAERGLSLFWSSRPFAASCGEYAGRPRIFWARESVAECFFSLVRALNAVQLAPQVEDCFRPAAVQMGLYRARVRAVREEFPSLSEEEVIREARAKTACAPYRAAHMGGAAIDYTLRDLEGRPLDLGNPYPAGGAATVLCFPYVTWAQFRTRQIFWCSAVMAGLVPYPGEDWHVSRGDGLAALVRGESVVKFGPLADFDRANGEVRPYDEAQARTFFPLS